MGFLNRITIRARLGGIVVLTLLGLAGMAASELYEVRATILAEREKALRDVIDIAEGVLARYEAEANAGRLPREQAQKLAMETIGAMRYSGGEYLWINDFDHKILLHPVKPELVGKTMADFQDPAGTYMFREFVRVAKEKGSGYVGYMWSKPGLTEPVDKLSHVRTFKPWGWIVGTGIYMDDVATAVWNEAKRALLMLTAMALVVIGASVTIARSITGPLGGMTDAMHRLAEGDTEINVAAGNDRTELSEMARAVVVFRDNAVARRQLEERQAAEQAAKERRSQRVDALIEQFERSIADVLRGVGSATVQLDATAKGMAAIAEETSRQAASSASASEQTSANVQTVAAAAEEMTSSLEEIARQVATSSSIAGEAVQEAGRTNVTVAGLSEAAQRIGDVVSLIQSIASQTNLLALNATIEAARAGEAGKGFAVVANEVKNLANQTAKATDEIAQHISAMQTSTGEAVAAIRNIGGTIAAMNDITGAISLSVEQQSAATSEICRNVGEAAAGTREVSDNLTQVKQAAGETGAAATQVLGASGELSSQAGALRKEVSRFLDGIRAA
ncbi:cache domain-containing protein [Azospirillum sp. SYSU D00513]|uniref:methyl-accepting chemotaxis protein n=1 Tax=Azospirillum sp. SYSU D00513 TaxID=2812561 RepID=UPI001A96F0B2|nr:cache domain-containing protein [Azospirillum sp. SYSU D00513]